MITDIFSSLNWGLILAIVFAVVTVLGAFPMWRKKKTRKMVFLLGFVGLVLAVILSVAVPVLTSPINFGTLAVGTPSEITGGGGQQVVATYQPTATYATQEKYSTKVISGTSYYKTGGLDFGSPATSTAITNTQSGKVYTYWVDNSSSSPTDYYWVTPLTFTAGVTTDNVNKEALANGTGTLTAYDLINKQALTTAGVYNTSMGANKQANVEFTYQGTNKKSAVPFGGIFVVEQNSSIGDVSCTGDVIGLNTRFHVTYTLASTNNAYKAYELTSGFDDGTGKVRTINCQYNNGASPAGAGSTFYAKIIPANYYVANNGNLILDTEKASDGSTTRTGSIFNLPSVSAYWGA